MTDTEHQRPNSVSDARLDLLRKASWIILLIGAAGSQAFMLYFGRNNTHLFITILFIVWVLGPYIALAIAARLVKDRPLSVRMLTYVVMLVVAIGSLVVYLDNLVRPRVSQPAFVFVAVPIASGLLIGFATGIALIILKRSSRDNL